MIRFVRVFDVVVVDRFRFDKFFNELFSELYHFAVEFLPHCIIFNSMFHLLSNLFSLSFAVSTLFVSLLFLVCMRTLLLCNLLNKFPIWRQIEMFFFCYYFCYRKRIRWRCSLFVIFFSTFFSMNEIVLLCCVGCGVLSSFEINWFYRNGLSSLPSSSPLSLCGSVSLFLDKLKNLPKQTTVQLIKVNDDGGGDRYGDNNNNNTK